MCYMHSWIIPLFGHSLNIFYIWILQVVILYYFLHIIILETFVVLSLPNSGSKHWIFIMEGYFFFHVKREPKKIDFSNITWWALYSWGTHLSMYSPYSQPYLSGFMLINLKMFLLHSVRLLLVRLLLRPM
jgi:hypothetical protein